MRTLLKWAISAGALYLTVWILDALGLADLGAGPWYSWFIAVIIMALINTSIRPIARFLTAPLNCLTFGLIGIVINGLMFALVPVIAEALGFKVFALKWPFGPLLGAILVGVIQIAVARVLLPREEEN